jgi:acetyl esterase/lipase
MGEQTLPTIHLPEREIPVPTSVSPQAQAILALGPLIPPRSYPSIDDHDAWRRMIAEQDEATLGLLAARLPGWVSEIETRVVGEGVNVYVARPPEIAADDRRVYLDIHGGALITGSGEVCRAMAAGTAQNVAAPVWSVDYRMPPDHPYPTPLDDCVAAYHALLQERDASEIVLGGSSAGGNLAAATALRAREEGLPLPAALVLNTPEIDLTESGDSFAVNMGLDPLITHSAMPANVLYANGHDLREPLISPLFADLSDLPPTILTTGTRDLLLSNTVLMHRALRRAGVEAELHVFEAAGHGGFLGQAPEDEERIGEIRSFIGRQWALRRDKRNL